MPQDIFNKLGNNDLGCDFSNATQVVNTTEDEKTCTERSLDAADANPLSYCLPGTTTMFLMDEDVKILQTLYKKLKGIEMKQANQLAEQEQEVQQKRSHLILERPPTTTDERMLGWAVDSRTHIDGKRRDKVFYHVSTEVKCRSLLEVYRFIKENKTPKELSEMKVEKQLQEGSSEKLKVKRKKQLKGVEVGLFNFKTKEVMRKFGQTIANGVEREKEMESASYNLAGPSVNWTTEMKRAAEEGKSDNNKSKVEQASIDGSVKEIVKIDDKISEDRNELMLQKIASQDNDSDKGDEAKSTGYIGLYVNYELI